MALTTTAIVKTRAGITGSGDDALIGTIVDGVSLAIANHCGRAARGTSLLERAADRTERCDGGNEHIQLACYPVELITSIKEASYGEFDDATALTAETEYYLQAAAGLIWRMPTGAKWLRGRGTVQVVYTGGYLAAGETPTGDQIGMPKDLIDAATIQAVHLYRNRDRLGIDTISAGGASLSVTRADLLPIVKQYIAPYRRW